MCEEKRTVFLVEAGYYSDRYVVGIFSSEEKARYAKSLYPEGHNPIPIVIDKLFEHPHGMKFFLVTMCKDGSEYTDHFRKQSVSQEDPEETFFFKEVDYHIYDEKSVYFGVWATDEKHALKIANEKRIALLAQNMLTTNREKWEKLFPRQG